MSKIKHFLKWITPKRCGHCERIKLGVLKRRQNTQYYYDDDNFESFCPKCQAYADEYWEHNWADFNKREY